MEKNKLDEKTLALLLAVSEITGQSHSPLAIQLIFNRSSEAARAFLNNEEQTYIYEGL